MDGGRQDDLAEGMRQDNPVQGGRQDEEINSSSGFSDQTTTNSGRELQLELLPLGGHLDLFENIPCNIVKCTQNMNLLYSMLSGSFDKKNA